MDCTGHQTTVSDVEQMIYQQLENKSVLPTELPDHYILDPQFGAIEQSTQLPVQGIFSLNAMQNLGINLDSVQQKLSLYKDQSLSKDSTVESTQIPAVSSHGSYLSSQYTSALSLQNPVINDVSFATGSLMQNNPTPTLTTMSCDYKNNQANVTDASLSLVFSHHNQQEVENYMHTYTGDSAYVSLPQNGSIFTGCSYISDIPQSTMHANTPSSFYDCKSVSMPNSLMTSPTMHEIQANRFSSEEFAFTGENSMTAFSESMEERMSAERAYRSRRNAISIPGQILENVRRTVDSSKIKKRRNTVRKSNKAHSRQVDLSRISDKGYGRKINEILEGWAIKNREYPYPTLAEKNQFMQKTGLSKMQLKNWFCNYRRRKLSPTTKYPKKNNY